MGLTAVAYGLLLVAPPLALAGCVFAEDSAQPPSKRAPQSAVEHGSHGARSSPELSSYTNLLASDVSEDDALGLSVSGLGDVNGDGYGDVIVGTSIYHDHAGAAYAYLGGPGGIDLSTELRIGSPSGEVADLFGRAVSGTGDIDGDGYDDTIIGAHRQDSGAAYVFLGGPEALATEPSLQIIASDEGRSFGFAVAGAGDANGDGFADVVIGAFEDHALSSYDDGSAYVYLGDPSGLDVASEIKLTLTGVSWVDAAYDYFGCSVDGAGDVDGDGFGDVIVGAVGGHAAYVHLGSDEGVDTAGERLTGSDGYGSSVAGAGDVNADGYADIIIGAPSTGSTGVANTYLGSATGVDLDSVEVLWPSDGEEDAYFGGSVSGAGDLDGDGYGDVVVGSKGWGDSEGRAYVFLGSTGGVDLSSELVLESPNRTAEDRFGASVAGIPDVDGDGLDDLIIGSPCDDSLAEDAGAAYVFYGTCYRNWFADADADGHGDPDSPVAACDGAALGYAETGDDCDDTDASTYPNAADTWYDGVDSDCDGRDDYDADHDGEESADHGGTDCDDDSFRVNSSATEVCDGIDNDCDGTIDGEDATGADEWFEDADGDGYTTDVVVTACDPPESHTDEASSRADCDDADPSIHPYAQEITGDGIDQDCDGSDPVSEPDEPPPASGCCSTAPLPTGSTWLLALCTLAATRRRRD